MGFYLLVLLHQLTARLTSVCVRINSVPPLLLCALATNILLTLENTMCGGPCCGVLMLCSLIPPSLPQCVEAEELEQETLKSDPVKYHRAWETLAAGQ